LIWVLMFGLALSAEEPLRIEYQCPREDIQSFGLACSEDDPCAVFLELSSVQALGAKLFAAGNLHTELTTLYSILLTSDDGGATWMEAYPRQRSAALEQVQFLDFEHGWISGQVIEPLPKDPFMLLTTDGGKTWRSSPLFEESRFGSISQFSFDSPSTGELVFERSKGDAARYELYQTQTGGSDWMPEETSPTPIHLKTPAKPSAWRVRADAATKTYRVERGAGASWEAVASFTIHVADCK
jgi:photosystem II stability/assembly factor-like uncharacterized protein